MSIMKLIINETIMRNRDLSFLFQNLLERKVSFRLQPLGGARGRQRLPLLSKVVIKTTETFEQVLESLIVVFYNYFGIYTRFGDILIWLSQVSHKKSN